MSFVIVDYSECVGFRSFFIFWDHCDVGGSPAFQRSADCQMYIYHCIMNR